MTTYCITETSINLPFYTNRRNLPQQRYHDGCNSNHMCIFNPGRVEFIQETHWGRVMHICVGNLTIIGSDNGLSPGRHQAIIWTNAGILSIGSLETNLSEILVEIFTFSFKKMYLKVSSAKWRPFCLGLNAIHVHLLSFLDIDMSLVVDSLPLRRKTFVHRA